MTLLVLTNNPHRASFRQRMTVYRDILAEQGVQTEVAVLPRGALARCRLFKRGQDFDGVFLHKKKLNPLDALALRRYSRRIIYNFDDAVMCSDKRPQSYSRAHFVPFRRTVRLADLVIVGSRYLAEQAQPFNSNIQVLPLGLDTRDYAMEVSPSADGRIRLVWIGSESTLGYLDLIRPAIERVLGRFPNVILRVISDRFPAWAGLPLEQVLWSPQSRREKLATSDIGLAPLPNNPFTRGKCSFKVLEYSASGLPVVASPVGTNTQYVRESVTGFLCRETDEWTDRIGYLVSQPETRRTMGRAGIEHARQFDVRVIGVQLARLILACLRGTQEWDASCAGAAVDGGDKKG